MAKPKARLDSSRANKKHTKRSKKLVKRLTNEMENKLVKLEDDGARASERVAVRTEYGKKITAASKPRGGSRPISARKVEKTEDKASEKPTKSNLIKKNRVVKTAKKRGVYED
jgi:hypothetical protein